MQGIEYKLQQVFLNLFLNARGKSAPHAEGGRSWVELEEVRMYQFDDKGQLPGYRTITDPAARDHVAGVWGVDPADLPGADSVRRDPVERLRAAVGDPEAGLLEDDTAWGSRPAKRSA